MRLLSSSVRSVIFVAFGNDKIPELRRSGIIPPAAANMPPLRGLYGGFTDMLQI